MSASEIIEQIKALPPAEQEEVRAFVTQLPPKHGPGQVLYASEAAVAEAGERIANRYPELFRKLAQ